MHSAVSLLAKSGVHTMETSVFAPLWEFWGALCSAQFHRKGKRSALQIKKGRISDTDAAGAGYCSRTGALVGIWGSRAK